MTNETIELLMVEDDPGDVDLAKEALRALGQTKVRLSIVEDGDRAISYLKRLPPYENAPRPDLILLDLNLPRKDGREVLEELKKGGPFQAIPVLIFTTSTAAKDIEETYRLGANCYITKPFEFSQYKRVFASVCEFWFGVATLKPG